MRMGICGNTWQCCCLSQLTQLDDRLRLLGTAQHSCGLTGSAYGSKPQVPTLAGKLLHLQASSGWALAVMQMGNGASSWQGTASVSGTSQSLHLSSLLQGSGTTSVRLGGSGLPGALVVATAGQHR